MKLKYVLFSGLLLSVGFTACTNEDFTEVTAPVNTSEAIALGEGYTITVNNGAATRAAFDSKYTPSWEEGDKLGAAWFHQINKDGFDEEKGEVTGVDAVGGGTYGEFYSNATMNLTKGAGTLDGTFTAQDESALSAGAYVLYYPHNGKSTDLVKESLPVELATYDVDCADPLKNINANMFAYSTVMFLPGEYATNDFTLGQVPVLVRLKFTPENVTNNELVGGITIEHIVIEATKGGSTVLAEAGKVAVDKTSTPAVQNYNKNEWAGFVTYTSASGTEEGVVNHLFINVAGSDNDNYKLLANGQSTKEEIIFSILPFSDEADKVTIKAVTDKGVYVAEYDAAVSTDKKYIDEFNNATAEGGQVAVNVKLDTTDPDGSIIYTTKQFSDAWDDAIKANEPKTLVIAEPMLLENTTLAIAEKVNADVTIKSEDGAEITVGAIDLKCGNLSFTGDVNVKGDINTTSDATLNVGGKLVAENLEIGGVAGLDEVEMESLYVTKYAEVALTLPADAKKAGEITVNGGTLTLNGGSLATIETNNDGKIVVAGNVTNTDTFTGAVSGTGKFINKKGATATFNVSDAVIGEAGLIVENAVGATINIEMPNPYQGTTWANTFRMLSGSKNQGTINVKKGQLVAEAGFVQDKDAARIYVDKDGMLNLNNNTISGLVVMNDKDATVLNVDGGSVAYSVNKVADLNTIPTEANNVFIDSDLEISKATTIAKNVYINANQTFSNGATLTCTWNTWVCGDITLSGKGTLKASNGVSSTLRIDGTLTLGDDITVEADKMSGADYRKITCKDVTKQVKTTVE